MAEADSKLSQNIDKIAYGIAGVLGLLVLALPFLMGGTAPKETEAAEQMRMLNERSAEDPKVEALPPPLREAIDKQWEVGPATADDPPWVVDRMPLVVRKIPKPPEENPVHTPGKITEIACGRDAEKKLPYVIVKGTLGEGNQHVVLDKVLLLRREGSGELAPLPEFKAAPGAGFEFQDHKVEAGKMYAYAVRTVAKRDPSAAEAVKALPAAEAEKTSEPLAMTSTVPHDFYLYISSFEPPKPDAPPRILGKLSYWDYKAGKLVEVKAGASVPFEEKEKFADNRFEFWRIEDTASKVTIRDNEKNIKYEIKSADSRTKRPVACFDPVTPGGPPEDEPEPEPKSKGKAKAAPKGKDAKGSKTTKKPTTKKEKETSSKTKPKTGTQKATEETKPKKRSFE